MFARKNGGLDHEKVPRDGEDGQHDRRKEGGVGERIGRRGAEQCGEVGNNDSAGKNGRRGDRAGLRASVVLCAM